MYSTVEQSTPASGGILAAPGLLVQLVRYGIGLTVLVLLVGCAGLEPMAEPELTDLQLTVDSLKSTVRETQRVLADVRIELDARRLELADAQVARAQLEGQLRETERRLAEARHIIDLQREELATARTERQRVSQAERQLHSQLKQLQKFLEQPGAIPRSPASDLAPAGFREIRPIPASPTGIDGTGEPFALSDPMASGRPGVVAEYESQNSSMGRLDRLWEGMESITVNPGDTLWRISQRYRVTLEELRSLNGLTGNLIIAGQTLRIPQVLTGTLMNTGITGR